MSDFMFISVDAIIEKTNTIVLKYDIEFITIILPNQNIDEKF